MMQDEFEVLYWYFGHHFVAGKQNYPAPLLAVIDWYIFDRRSTSSLKLEIFVDNSSKTRYNKAVYFDVLTKMLV